MAELPRYRRDSLLVLLYPTCRRETGSARRRKLTNAMNRVSEFAFSIAKQQAKIDGAEFGAVNAPTSEQLEIAKSTVKTCKTLPVIVLVFLAKCKSSSIGVLTTNMEKEARETITAFLIPK